MRLHKIKTVEKNNSEDEKSKEQKKQERLQKLKAIGLGIAAIGTAGLAFFAAASINKSSESECDFSDEVFDDWNSINGEPDESYAAEDYISSRPWGIDNDGW